MATVFVNPLATDMSATASYLAAVDGASTGTLPSSGDTLVFYGGTSEIVAGHAALAAVDFAEVRFLSSCKQTCKTPLQLMVSHSGGPGLLTYYGSGSEFELQADGDGIDKAIVAPRSGQVRLSSDGAAAWTQLNTGGGGQVVAEASAVVPTWINSGADLVLRDGTASTNGYHNAGMTKDYRGTNNPRVADRGTYQLLGDAAVSGTVTLSGGTFNPRTSGTIAKVVASGRSVYTPKGSPVPVTVTNMDIIGLVGSGPTIVKDDDGATTVFTNDPVSFGNIAPIVKGGGETDFGSGA